MSTTSPITLSSLRFIKPAVLAESLRTPSTASNLAIIDVRDDDHIGGHIKSSQWIPSHQLDVKIPELLRTLRDKDQVIFHCMLSQQRGPKAALTYARAKAYEEEKRKRRGDSGGHEPNETNATKSDSERAADVRGKIGGQEICVLEGGFGSWQSLYGEDKAMTENYQKDLWL